MPHGSYGFRGVGGHRQDLLLYVLVGIAEHSVQAIAHFLTVGRNLLVRDLKLCQLQQIQGKPLTIRIFFGILLLAFLIQNQAAFFGIDEQDFAGLETRLLDNVRRVNIQHPDLGGQNQTMIIGNVISGGTQAVAIQGGAGNFAVSKQNGCRTVPGLHHGCIVMIKVLLLLFHVGIILPGLGNHHHNCQRKRHAVHHKEFEGVIQHGGIRTGSMDYRESLVGIFVQPGGMKSFFTRQHAVMVSANGIDLAVMRNKTVRMGPFPGRGGVGGEAGMHHGNGCFIIPALQISIETAQLTYQKHSLVNDRSGGQGIDIGIFRALFKFPSAHIEPAIEIDTS